MKGNDYRDRIAAYVLAGFGEHGVVVYTEVHLGKTIIGKDRKVDVFVVRQHDQRAVALECKFQDSQGTQTRARARARARARGRSLQARLRPVSASC